MCVPVLLQRHSRAARGYGTKVSVDAGTKSKTLSNIVHVAPASTATVPLPVALESGLPAPQPPGVPPQGHCGPGGAAAAGSTQDRHQGPAQQQKGLNAAAALCGHSSVSSCCSRSGHVSCAAQQNGNILELARTCNTGCHASVRPRAWRPGPIEMACRYGDCQRCGQPHVEQVCS